MKQTIKDGIIAFCIVAVFVGLLMIHRTNTKHACEMPTTTYTLLVQYNDTTDTVSIQEPKGRIMITNSEKNGEPVVIVSAVDTTGTITLWAQDYIGASKIIVINDTDKNNKTK